MHGQDTGRHMQMIYTHNRHTDFPTMVFLVRFALLFVQCSSSLHASPPTPSEQDVQRTQLHCRYKQGLQGSVDIIAHDTACAVKRGCLSDAVYCVVVLVVLLASLLLVFSMM